MYAGIAIFKKFRVVSIGGVKKSELLYSIAKT